MISCAGRMVMEQGVHLDEKEVKVTTRSFQQSMILESMQMHNFQSLKRLFKDLGYKLCFFEMSVKFLPSQKSYVFNPF